DNGDGIIPGYSGGAQTLPPRGEAGTPGILLKEPGGGRRHAAPYGSLPPTTVRLLANRPFLGGGPGGDLGAGGEAELGEDAFDVALGGAQGDDQFGGDLPVAQALGDQLGDLAFPGGQHAWGASRGGRMARGGRLFAQCVGDGLIKAEVGA